MTERYRCDYCNEPQTAETVYWRNIRGVRKPAPICEVCNKARRRRYWLARHDLNKARLKASRLRRKAAGKLAPWTQARWVREVRAFTDWLKECPCTDCGVSLMPCAMDFDHVRGEKFFSIGMIRSTQCKGITQDEVLEEIQKCELVCANCHRIRTFKRKNPQYAVTQLNP